jgi:hypothetical protein
VDVALGGLVQRSYERIVPSGGRDVADRGGGVVVGRVLVGP